MNTLQLDTSQDKLYRPLGPPIGGVQQGGSGGGGSGGGQGGYGPRGPPPPQGGMGMSRPAYPTNPSYPQQDNFRGHPQAGYDYRGGNHMGGNGHTTVVVQPSQPSVIYGGAGGGGYGGGSGFSGGSLAMGNIKKSHVVSISISQQRIQLRI